MSLNIGDVLQGRYRVARLLGQGGMGAVYRVWDMRLNAPRAVKEMTPQPDLNRETLTQLQQQFQQEAAVLANLSHPHLVRVTDFFEEGGNAYLVMDFIEGESLAARIAREGCLPESKVLAWADQLLDALEYCHGRGIIHRDIKPQNVIVRPDGRVILVDFGLVKLWNPGDPRTRTVIRSMGTPEYAPPEQYDSQSGFTDARSDLYSLGATLYHALTGQTPPTATMRIVNPSSLAPVRRLNPQVSPYLEAILLRMLELRPEARFQTATELRMALRQSGGLAQSPAVFAGTAVMGVGGPPGAGYPYVPSTPSSPVRPFPWRILGLTLALLVVLVLAGLTLANLIERGRETSATIGDVTLTAEIETQIMTPVEAPATQEVLATETVTPPAAEQVTEVPTATEPPTATPTETATATTVPTALPTSTPSPTKTSPPTATPTPACPEVTGPFAEVWRAEQSRLGCATNPAHSSWLAVENFEKGLMFWREDSDRIFAVYQSGTWQGFANTWRDGDPTYTCGTETTPPTPLRGFGKAWCSNNTVREGLGSALDLERGFDSTLQDFERGIILRMDTGTIYLLFADGKWSKH